jgi:GNAT superfamily N-acetyltransferase
MDMIDNLKIIRMTGPEIFPYMDDLARLRIQVFHDYPYLYEGDLEYEKNYLKVYTNCPASVLVLVFDEKKIVGASSALPLASEADYVKKPFLDAQIEVENIFYFGESVLLNEYRGLGIGKRFFKERETAAQEQKFNITTFCGVERPTDHPQRPKNWRPLDTFWIQQGYQKHPELTSQFSWKDIGNDHETLKTMFFWMKYL